MILSSLHSVYFVGIGGIGMSALARYFNCAGVRVAGYDRACTELTTALEKEGMEVYYTDDAAAIPQWFLNTPLDKALVVYTPAIPVSHYGLSLLRNHGCVIMKRAEVLSSLTEGLKTIAVGGTHGKTSTSALTAHIIRDNHIPLNAFLGGISVNYGTNVLLDKNASLAVAEADEYDRSFMRLNPYIAVITSVEADHLDIYGSEEEVVRSFNAFASKVDPQGTLIHKHGIPVKASGSAISYAVENNAADLVAGNVHVADGAFHYSVSLRGKLLGQIVSHFPGRHNVDNTLAAIAVALQLNIPWEGIVASVASFQGVKRRFEFQIKRGDLVYIDDYAHHPTEISSCINAAKELYPGKKVTGVFQPHLYTRTRDFADDFAQSLAQLHELLLMEIYPAREEPIPGVTSEWLLNKIPSDHKRLVARSELVREIEFLAPEVLLTMGAGDIDKMVKPIKDALENKAK